MRKPQLMDWHLIVRDTPSPELVNQISRSSVLIEFHTSKLVLGHVTYTTDLHGWLSPTLVYFKMLKWHLTIVKIVLQIALT